MIDTADRLLIHELIADYGHLIDGREFSRLSDNMTDDVVYDMSDFGMGVARGLEEVVEMWTGPLADHPLAHHATNIVVREDPDGTVRAVSKGLGVGVGGRVGSVTYHDVVRRTDRGWRIAERRGVLRRPETIPPIG